MNYQDQKDTLDYITDINAAQSVSEVWDTLQSFVLKTGFSNVIYGLTRHFSPCSVSARDDCMILSNHASSYIDPYMDDGLYMHGPMVRWASENEGAKSWAHIMQQYPELSDEARRVVDFNRRHGIMAGYTISYHHPVRKIKAAIALSMSAQHPSQAEADEIWMAHARDIEAVCSVAHHKILALPAPDQVLTKRQYQVLEAIADGLSVQETANKLSLSRPAIEKHLHNARKGLNAKNTTQAVVRTFSGNLMYNNFE